MSPEQARGQEVDARTDVWSLGVMLYEMVAGRSPFAGPTGTDVLAAILERDPTPLARVDPAAPLELQRIVSKALRKNRQQRYQHTGDLLLDLRALSETSGTRPESAAAAILRRGALRLRSARLALTLAALVLVVGAAILFRTRSPGAILPVK